MSEVTRTGEQRWQPRVFAKMEPHAGISLPR